MNAGVDPEFVKKDRNLQQERLEIELKACLLKDVATASSFAGKFANKPIGHIWNCFF